MIARPTTEQILEDCSRQLLDVVLPALSDETVQVTVMMMDLILRNMAQRAAHEIAWMTAEIDVLSEYAGEEAAPPVGPDGLHLDAVVERYCRAGEAFSRALEEAVAAGDAERVRRGTELLARRAKTEEEIMCGWSPVGR
jgi:hypothetical protein